MQPRRALLLINSGSRSGQTEGPQVAHELERLGFEVLQPESSSPTEYPALIQSHRGRADLVVVAGGDGSVKFAAEGAWSAGLPLGIVPLGTANNVAKSLGLPESFAEACRLIAEGDAQPMDLARVNGILFVSVIGIGLSTDVHSGVPHRLKKWLGPVAYAWQAIRSLREMRGFRVEIRGGPHPIRAHAVQVTVCNGRHYGGKLQISDSATLHDGRLDLLMIRAANPLRGFWHALRKRGPMIRRASSRSFTIHSWPRMAVDVEGSPCTHTPARVELVPGAIRVFAPKREPASVARSA